MKTASFEVITPQIAQRYLEKNTSNRELRPAVVRRYANAMLNGLWEETHQGIAFNKEGVLIDGQHRLSAIVMSGVTQKFLVARGVEHKASIAIDVHAKRNFADTLSASRGESVNKRIIAVIRAMVELSTSRLCLSVEELNDTFYDEYREAAEWGAEGTAHGVKGLSSAPVLAAFAVAWFYVDDLDRVMWCKDILYGRSIPTCEGDRAALTLRENLIKAGRMNSSSSDRRELFFKTQKTIDAFSKSQPLKKAQSYGAVWAIPVDESRRVR